MVKAELKYNPYLNETEITFNGKKPRINSLVEKHYNERLQNWVSEIPKIFHDEMNGYDFDLEFCGTRLDYEEVCNSFLQKDIKEDQVRVIYKNELNGRAEKQKTIENILEWMNEKRNRIFDYAKFIDENQEELQYEYNIEFVHMPALMFKDIEETGISSENVDDIAEMGSIDLENTPVVFWIDDLTMHSLKRDLECFLKRSDVRENQLFFMCKSNINVDRIKRKLKDYGIEVPQIISGIDEFCFQKYLEVYPQTDYISQCILIFDQISDELSVYLSVKNKENEENNIEIYKEINRLDKELDHLKAAHSKFENRDFLVIPDKVNTIYSDFMKYINTWHKTRIKMTKQDDAYRRSLEFNTYIRDKFDIYKSKLDSVLDEYESSFKSEYYSWMCETELDEAKKTFENNCISTELVEVPDISEKLLNSGHEVYVAPRDYRRLIKLETEKSEELVQQITYFYDEWRQIASDFIEPLAQQYMNAQFENKKNSLEAAVDFYKRTLEKLILTKSEEKNQITASLSKDGQLLQEDNNWYTEFAEQIEDLKRA